MVNILILFLTDNWNREHLPKAVVIMNLQDGVATILAVVLAHIADSYIGRFAMIVFTSIAYISVCPRLSLYNMIELFFYIYIYIYIYIIPKLRKNSIRIKIEFYFS